MKQFIQILIFIFCILTGNSQKTPSDIQLLKDLRGSNPDSAILLGNKLLNSAKYKNNNLWKTVIYNCLGTACHFSGQPEKAISNYKKGITLAEKEKNDTLQIFIYNNLALLHQDYYGFKKTVEYARKALHIAKSKNMYCETGDSYNNLGSINMYYSRFDSSFFYYYKGIEEYKKEKTRKYQAESGIADINTNLGYLYLHQGKQELALTNYIESLKIFDKHKEWVKASYAANNIADLFHLKNDFKKALKYARISVAFNKKEYRGQAIANAYFILGKVYQDTKNTDSALIYYKKAESIYEDLDLSFQKTILFNSLGTYYAEENNQPESMKYFFKSLELNILAEDTASICLNYFNIAHNYFVSGNIAEAAKYNGLALELLQSGIFYSTFADVYGQAADIYALQGKFEKAYEYVQKRNIYYDSMHQENTQRRQEEIEAIYQNEKKEKENKFQKTLIEKKTLELEHAEKEKEVQNYQIRLMTVGGIAMLFFLFFIVRSNRIRKRNNKILEEKNTVIYRQKAEVEKQKDELTFKNLIIEEKQKEITDSINYARRIQFSLLAHEQVLKNNLNDYFILFQPKDIVSGDFYWSTSKPNGDFYMAVCDCTGHGVPGAFMSLLNISFLNEAINEKNISETGKVLDFVRERLVQNMEGGKDGMDAILIKKTGNKIYYSAAHNKPVLIRKNLKIELEADKMPVGMADTMNPFKTFEINSEKNDTLYLTTDGYADQFGGEKKKKFKSANLHKLLLEISDLNLTQQKNKVSEIFENWKGDLEQVDDVCVIGIKL
jgi:serine phosphatase RsbU (regulator of sigma subunit)/tetratricopeptide (TPR) repeat protein